MKALSSLLSIYILVLTLMPCDDVTSNSTSSYEELTEISSYEKIQFNATHEHEDHCSPLCLCNCCQNIVFLPQQFHFSDPEVHPTGYQEYLIFMNGSGYFDFLKPPRL